MSPEGNRNGGSRNSRPGGLGNRSNRGPNRGKSGGRSGGRPGGGGNRSGGFRSDGDRSGGGNSGRPGGGRFNNGPNRSKTSGGRFGGGNNRSFNKNNFKRQFELHKAICSDCKKECEVPFKPTKGKPVYCRECFSKHKNNK